MLRRRNDESSRCKEGKKGKVPYGVSETSQPPSSDGGNTGEGKRDTHNTSPQYGIPHCEWIGAGTDGRLARTLWTPNEGREMWYSVARKMHNSEFRGAEARLASPCLPSENRWIAAARQGCSSSRPLAFPLNPDEWTAAHAVTPSLRLDGGGSCCPAPTLSHRRHLGPSGFGLSFRSIWLANGLAVLRDAYK
ncbi:hypothetical protein BDP81DRAFT_19815 [Colletotrichum phormii]|uniref:Uncharacterized protein n=1 Tax=Colletotrichum phormii TaxID=359342 RepID=A0AAJ0ELH1_9PEZI|nr:uncharacterized protein BDP81DRAFT_19815 [Colletotrichum phormii]KAK1656326.1 hypothetical protein BDP81DRAFT_19815 [Colletotrichum phormii]